MTDQPYCLLARNQLALPADPVCVLILICVAMLVDLLQNLTDRELLSCHAEVKALQNQLGTSYKDTSHCLYMAEVEKLEQQDITLKTYATLKERMEYNLNSFESRLLQIPIRPLSHESANDTMADPPANSHITQSQALPLPYSFTSM